MRAKRRARRKRTCIPRRQWTLPAGIHQASGRPATLREVLDPDVPTVFFHEMSKRRQVELVVERIRRQRGFRLWVMGGSPARVGKTRAIHEVSTRTPLGEALIQVEGNLIAMVSEEVTRRRRR